MGKSDELTKVEKALQRLMPSAISEELRAETEAMLDELSGPRGITLSSAPKRRRWIPATAAAITLICASGFYVKTHTDRSVSVVVDDIVPQLVSLAESDRIERVSDDGLYVDAGGSAVRKVRVRVVEESQMRDEESGIVFSVSEPREEMYLVPVSNF